MAKKVFSVILNAVPIILMIGLIPFVSNDYLLAALYSGIIIAALFLWHTKHDIQTFVLGFVLMIVSETFFVMTGVEVFTRESLLGFMPLWLPLLWGYSFVVIKRTIHILNW